MGISILTSAGFLNQKIADFFIANTPNISSKKVAIITTAAEGKENHKYSKLAYSQFESFGFKYVDFVDLEENTSIEPYDVIYVCGGNVFYLMKYAMRSNFRDAVMKFLEKGGIYIGVSAGSLIVGPSVKIASEVNPDDDSSTVSDFAGLNIFPLTIFPHYEAQYEEAIKNFEARNGTSITRLTNNEAIIIKDGIQSKISE